MKNIKLAITICATTNYKYAMRDQAIRLQAACFYANINNPYIIIVSNESSPELAELYKNLFPNGEYHELIGNYTENPNYQKEAQIEIAKMRTRAFSHARSLNVDYCLSMDSDVLPPPNGLKSCFDALQFDNNYYGAAAMLYTSQGGGLIMCGRGTAQNPILPNIYEDEFILSKKYEKFKKKYSVLLDNAIQKQNEKDIYKYSRVLKRYHKLVEMHPVKPAAIGLSPKNWRPRGWFDFAYPGIGRGAIVPSDWAGFGAILLSSKALSAAIFEGYQGLGTEDLWINWRCWRPLNIRIAAVAHCLCDHICRKKNNEGVVKYFHVKLYFEEDSERVGHINQIALDYIPLI